MNYFWLSFRDPDINLNLGCTIINDADDLDTAIQKAWDLGINPGGEVLGTLMTEEMFKEEGLEADRLYTRSEMIELGYEKIGKS